MVTREQIEQVCQTLEQPMLETLQTLIRIPSVKGEAEEGAVSREWDINGKKAVLSVRKNV